MTADAKRALAKLIRDLIADPEVLIHDALRAADALDDEAEQDDRAERDSELDARAFL